jgi:hypothetical protein
MLVVRKEKRDSFQASHIATFLIVMITTIGIVIIAILSIILSARIIFQMQTMHSEKKNIHFQLIRAVNFRKSTVVSCLSKTPRIALLNN